MIKITLVLLTLFLSSFSLLFAGGSTEQPSAPAPAEKTWAEISAMRDNDLRNGNWTLNHHSESYAKEVSFGRGVTVVYSLKVVNYNVYQCGVTEDFIGEEWKTPDGVEYVTYKFWTYYGGRLRSFEEYASNSRTGTTINVRQFY